MSERRRASDGESAGGTGAVPGFSNPYSGYDVRAKWHSPSWDDTTREVVRKRLDEVPSRRFLTEAEWATLDAVCARLVPQPDRPDDPVPITPWIDRKLDEDAGSGYRFADMPPMRAAWRRGLRAIDAEARGRHDAPFTALDAAAQDALLHRVQCGDVTAHEWEGLPAARFFSSALLTTVVATYYAHPAAWSECGFGGPASPRGYVRLGPGERDQWEAGAQTDEARTDRPSEQRQDRGIRP